MKSLQEAIQPIVSMPTPVALLELQGTLLARHNAMEAVERALEVTAEFYHYLSELQSKLAARDYSELASRLDIGAVGAVALENLLCAEGKEFWKRLALGGMAEGLMVAASRQYVKGWQVETGLVYSRATWYLSRALWQLSSETQADLPDSQRWEAIQRLLAPARDPDVPAAGKALLLGRIYQVLLLSYLVPLLPESGAGS
jgi:hypothetical protein